MATEITHRDGSFVLPELRLLSSRTEGDPRICVAVLDGPVDRSHFTMTNARLMILKTLASGTPDGGAACRHGTHVASIIFGQPRGPVLGIAPLCRGLIIPIFRDGVAGGLAPCSQIDLARAMLRAAQCGAHVINISGGQLAAAGARQAHSFLVDAVRYCVARNILIVAAAGNDGCACLHLPAALPGVLVVGAMNRRGEPFNFSNWGKVYQTQGILAPGDDVPGALCGGGVVTQSGTSSATAIVSGVAALLLSLQLKLGRESSPTLVRDALLSSARRCDHQPIADCSRILAGRLNIEGAKNYILQGVVPMTDLTFDEPAVPASTGSGQLPATSCPDEDSIGGLTHVASTFGEHQSTAPSASVPSFVTPSACACSTATAPPQLVYTLGTLGFDYGTESRRDSIQQHMKTSNGSPNPYDPRQLLGHFDTNPWDASAIIWTLHLDATPMYAIRPDGPFVADVCLRLREFLRDQLDEGVERISIPGVIDGHVTLLNGQVVPVIRPELRGMYSWNTHALVEAVVGKFAQVDAATEEKEAFEAKSQGVRNFLERVYYEVRNLGVTSEERALNFAATNAFNIERVYESAAKDDMELDTVEVELSPICRPGADCWDVKLLFFYPQRQVQAVRKAYRFTIDVSDIVPVTVGTVRSWFVR